MAAGVRSPVLGGGPDDDPYATPLRALDPPTLVVWGAADAYLPREQAERQRQTFPSARIEVLEGVGHWSFLEEPERVASLVVPFLTEQLGRSASEDPVSWLR